MFSAATELKSKDRGRQGSLCSHQLFCWNLMGEMLPVWETVYSGPVTWAWPVSWHDKGHWHTPLSFQVVMFVHPFPHAQESQILNCHQVTAEDSYHRFKGKSSLSFCAILRAKSLKPQNRATPIQFKVSHTFHPLHHAEARPSLCRVSELKYCSPKHIWNRSALLNKHV